MTCAAPTCDRPRQKREWCEAHYQRLLSGRDMDAPLKQVLYARGKPKPATCTHRDCESPHYSAGFCNFHYIRSYNGQDLDAPRKRNPVIPGVTTKVTKQGYVHLWLPEHPSAFGKGWVIQHRYVMEQMLGRPLTDIETVHHINGVKTDNRPENLELWASFQPAGQRVVDLVAYARELLALYGDLDYQMNMTGTASVT